MCTRQQEINRYELWLASVRRANFPRKVFPCPSCNTRLVALTPAAGVKWDTAATCPYCGTFYYRIIYADAQGQAHVKTEKA